MSRAVVHLYDLVADDVRLEYRLSDPDRPDYLKLGGDALINLDPRLRSRQTTEELATAMDRLAEVAQQAAAELRKEGER